MSNRRVWITGFLQRVGERAVATVQGLAGEEFETEVFEPYGFSSNPDGGEAVLHEINGDANNHIAGMPIGIKTADDETTLIYYGDTQIELTATDVTVSTEGVTLKISDGCIETDADIKTTGDITATGDIIAGTTSLKTHIHTAPNGPTSAPTV